MTKHQTNVIEELKKDARLMKALGSKMPIQISTLEWLIRTIEDIEPTREMWGKVPKINARVVKMLETQ